MRPAGGYVSNSPTGAMLVELEFGPKICTPCGQSIPKGAIARFSWEPSKLGTFAHETCVNRPVTAATPPKDRTLL